MHEQIKFDFTFDPEEGERDGEEIEDRGGEEEQ